jgi:uncharacterized protein (TIGR03437 family)
VKVKAMARKLLAALALASSASNAQTVVNAASGGSAVAPGSIISIYGSFPFSLGQAFQLPLPTVIDTYYTFSTFGSKASPPIPLFFWSGTQVNALLPTSTADKTLALFSARLGMNSAIGQALINLQSQAPGIFTNPTQDCSLTSTACSLKLTRGIITDAAGNLISSTNPAKSQQIVVIWATGIASAADTPSGRPTVNLASVLGPSGAAVSGNVLYAGPTVLQGLDQINFRVPSFSPCIEGQKADASLTVKSTVSGIQSNAVWLPVINSCAIF